MIDAYTIGIRLALTDDLSRPLATIQRRLAALDGAIGRSGVGLRALSRLSADLAPPDFSRLDGRQGRPSDARPRWVAPFPAVRPVGSTLPEAAGPRSLHNPGSQIGADGLPDWTAAARLLLGQLPDTPNAHQAWSRSRGTAMRRPGDTLGSPATTAKRTYEASANGPESPAASPRPRMDDPAAGERWLAAARASGAADGHSGGPPAQLPAAPPPAGTKSRDFAGFARDLLAAMSAGTASPQTGRHRDDAAQGYAEAAQLPQGPWDVGRRSERAPPASERGRRAAALGEAEPSRYRRTSPSSGAPRRAAAPTLSPVRDRMMRTSLDRTGEFTGAGGAGATQPIAPDRTGASAGELVLDGARFGRLICDRLARHIDHPRSGLTGADPRLTPTWPGAAWG